MKIRLQTIMRTLACLLVLTPPLLAKAQAEFLIVQLQDGSTTSFALTDHPIIKTSDGLFSIEAENIGLSVPISEVLAYSFSDLSAIEETMVNSTYRLDNDHIFFSNMKSNETISIFSLKGILMVQANADSDGAADINISQLPVGPHIVKTGSSSFKFIKK